MNYFVTGTILYTQDPVNAHFENLYVDTWEVIAGFMFWPNCNYPEANIIPTINVKNFTAFVSSEDSTNFRPNIFYYSGPGNITAIDVNITDAYGLTNQGLSNFLVSVEAN